MSQVGDDEGKERELEEQKQIEKMHKKILKARQEVEAEAEEDSLTNWGRNSLSAQGERMGM